MSVELQNIDALFQKRYADDVEETAIKDTPYFLSNTNKVKISKEYSVPINLKPAHSLRYSANPFDAVEYSSFRSPVIKEAKGEITSKFFKVEVPLGVIDALNKTDDDDSLAFSTASYFIDNAVKTNMLLAELSYMYGENGLPSFTSVSDKWRGETLGAKEVVVGIDKKGTSDIILKLMINAIVSVFDKESGSLKGDPIWQFEVSSYDRASGKLKLVGDEEYVTELKKLNFTTPYSLRMASQHGNDNIGIYDLMTKNGVVLGIDSNYYSNWEASSFSMNNNPLTVSSVKNAVSQLIVNGSIEDEDVTLYVSQKSWDAIAAEIESNRRFDYSYNKEIATVGQRKVGLVHSNGLIEIKYHPLMKENTAFLMTNIFDANNLITLTTGDILSFENDKKFQTSENNSSAYVIGKMYFSPFMRNRTKHMVIVDIN